MISEHYTADSIFPVIDDIDESEVHQSDMLDGYPDLDGNCIAFFSELSPEDARALRKFVRELDDPVYISSYLIGLVRGYNVRDKLRLSQTAQQDVNTEIDLARRFSRMIDENDELPRFTIGPVDGDDIRRAIIEGNVELEFDYKGWEMMPTQPLRGANNELLKIVTDESDKLMADPEYEILATDGPIDSKLKEMASRQVLARMIGRNAVLLLNFGVQRQQEEAR